MAEEEEVVEPPKPSKLGGILTIVNLAVTGLIAFKVMTFKPVAPVVQQSPQSQEDYDPDAPGPIKQFEEPLVVNLNEPRGGRFLKMQIAFELSHPKYVEDFDRSERLVRDEMLRYLSSLTVADTMGEAAKMTIQKQIVARVDQVLGGKEGRPRVKRVYFEEFVVQ